MELVKIQIPLNRNPEKISELSHKSKIRLKWLILCAPCPQLSMICFSNSDPDGRKSKARYSFIYYCLLLLSCFSCVQLCATPETAAHQAPPSLGFSSQEHSRGCHFLLQCMKVKSESEVAQSCLTLRDPMDCSPPGSSVQGTFQARVLEWDAIAFSMH